MTQETSEALQEPVPSPVTAPAQSVASSGVSQEVMNAAIGRVRAEAREKGLAEGRAQAMNEYSQAQQQQASTQYSNQGVDVGEIAAQKAREVFAQEQAQRDQDALQTSLQNISSTVRNKISEDGKNIPEFENTLKNSGINIDHVPNLTLALGSVDNPAHVLAELAKHPTSVLNLERNASYMTPQDLNNPNHPVFAEIRNISRQINQNSAPVSLPDEPLSAASSSKIAVGSGSTDPYQLAKEARSRTRR